MSAHPVHLLLDCDGVLVTSESIAAKAERIALEGLGASIDIQQYRDATLGLSETHHIDAVFEMTSRAHLRLSRSELEKALSRARWEAYKADLAVLDGMADIVNEYGSRISIVSSSTKASVERKLRMVRIQGLAPERIFGSQADRQMKSDVYISAIAQLHTSPEKCIAVEDSVSGVAAATEAGISAWGLTQDSKERDETLKSSGAVHTFKTASELQGELQKISWLPA